MHNTNSDSVHSFWYGYASEKPEPYLAVREQGSDPSALDMLACERPWAALRLVPDWNLFPHPEGSKAPGRSSKPEPLLQAAVYFPASPPEAPNHSCKPRNQGHQMQSRI